MGVAVASSSAAVDPEGAVGSVSERGFAVVDPDLLLDVAYFLVDLAVTHAPDKAYGHRLASTLLALAVAIVSVQSMAAVSDPPVSSSDAAWIFFKQERDKLLAPDEKVGDRRKLSNRNLVPNDTCAWTPNNVIQAHLSTGASREALVDNECFPAMLAKLTSALP